VLIPEKSKNRTVVGVNRRSYRFSSGLELKRKWMVDEERVDEFMP